MIARGFTHILIPVDFSRNTEVSIQKAIELAGQHALISLLHVLPGLDPETEQAAEKEMKVYREKILSQNGQLSVETYINPGGDLSDVITGYSRIIRPDLIIVARRKVRRIFRFLNSISPDELSARSGFPVLSVKTFAKCAPIRTILVYISGSTSMPDLEPLKILCSRFRVKIYLVAFNSTELSQTVLNNSFKQIYQWVKSSLHCPVEYCMLDNANRSRALASFGNKIDADILLVQSEEQKQGWIRHSVPDLVHACSEMQVLSLQ